jgi:small subunit ribosomal protein S6
MAYYESVFIARQDISPQQVEALTEQFSNIIQENGGTVAGTEYWGLKNLAYRIKKYRKGHYVMMNLDAPSDAVKEMERNIRLNEDIVRLLTIKVDALEEGPSVMMQKPQPRDNHRGGPRDRDNRDRGDRDNRDRAPRAQGAAPAKAANTEGGE